jgi:hypothetical protein
MGASAPFGRGGRLRVQKSLPRDHSFSSLAGDESYFLRRFSPHGSFFSYTDTTFPIGKSHPRFRFLGTAGSSAPERERGGNPPEEVPSALKFAGVFRPSDFESQTEVAHPARSFSVCGSLSVFAASFTVSFRVSSLPPGFTIGVTSNPEGYRPSIEKPESCGQGAVSHPNERL